MRSLTFFLIIALLAPTLLRAQAPSGVKKIGDVTIYQDKTFYVAFPSVVRRPDGELLLAFRRAPDRRNFGDSGYSHADANSYLVLTRSRDQGATWTAPQTFFAHPFGGSQDPCLLQLRDGTLLAASYAWSQLQPAAIEKLKQPLSITTANNGAKFAFLGGFLLRSADGGRTWGDRIVPPPVDAEQCFDVFGQKVPAYNRGALTEGSDGRIYWVVAVNASVAPRRHETHLLVSSDKGSTWTHASKVASDPKITFNEASIYETPKGDLVAFLRTAGFGDKLVMARSKDRGKSFQPWEEIGFQGHPFHAMRLPDNRVLLVYGYRHKPYGIRARILDAECTNAAIAPEIVLRDDGGTHDLGYPWSVMISEKRALVVYYFNRDNGTRSIEGTVLELQE